MRSGSLATIVGIIGLALAAAVMPGAAHARGLPLTAKVRSAAAGPSELRVQVSAKTRRKARCGLVVRSGGRHLSFPRLVASRGSASWRWIVPSGAPSGRWRFTVRCTRSGAKASRTRSALVLAPAGGTAAGFIAPGTLSVRAGRFASKPPDQFRNVDPNAGSKGAGINPGDSGYCTWGAWNLAQWLGTAVRGHAKNWYASARASGLPTGTEPRPGAVFVRTDGDFGHVGIVTGIISKTAEGTRFSTREMNGGNRWTDKANGKTNEFGQYKDHEQSTGPNMFFIYKPGTQPGAWVNTIVQWDGDTKAQKTAWLVGPDGKRRWIPDIATYWCLKGLGVPGPTALPPAILDEYPDLNGVWVKCSPSGGIGAGTGDPPPTPTPGPGTPPPTPTPTPPPAPRTWTEQQGSRGANSFTNPYNASGMGPRVPAAAYVEVSCKVHAPAIASVNPDGYWYRIASPPWNNQYYAAANTFMNGDPWGGPYSRNTDWAVPNC